MRVIGKRFGEPFNDSWHRKLRKNLRGLIATLLAGFNQFTSFTFIRDGDSVCAPNVQIIITLKSHNLKKEKNFPMNPYI